MNKSDLLLIGIILVLSIGFILGIKWFDKNGEKKALVYYENNLVLEIDLTIDEQKEFNVKGNNGNVLIVSENGRVKVAKEKSPLHLCSKQGWIDSVYETIVCLPNKVVVEIETKKEIDAVVK